MIACPPAVKSARLTVVALLLMLLAAHLTFQRLSLTDSASIRTLRAFSSYRLTHEPLIPRRIWQTWLSKPGAEGEDAAPNEELTAFSRTWSMRNPGYQYTSLDDAGALDFVRTHYRKSPEVIRLFEEVTEPVVRADLIRYLVLYARGGVYSDYDTEVWRSVDLWTGEYDNRDVGLIVGVEYDQRDEEEILPGMSHHVQFCQWTLASRPGHPVMRHVLETVVSRVIDAHRQGGIEIKVTDDVLNMTGPKIFSEAVRQGVSKEYGFDLDFKTFSMLNGPSMFGDVMILPINAFASGVGHSGSDDWGNEQQLVAHHFRGKWKEGLEDA